MGSAIDKGREAFGRRAWDEARHQLTRADSESGLNVDDLERLATASHLAGDHGAAEVWERAYHEYRRLGEPARAARCAFWLAHSLFDRGEVALGGGWLARAEKALDDASTASNAGISWFRRRSNASSAVS